MELKQQVCTIEQAIKLAKLGISQTGAFEHIKRNNKDWSIRLRPYIDTADFKLLYSAFTVAELGLILPAELPAEGEHIKMLLLQCQKPWQENDKWLVGYLEINTDLDSEAWIYTINGMTEAQARAEMVIYLLENKLITVEACNMALAA